MNFSRLQKTPPVVSFFCLKVIAIFKNCITQLDSLTAAQHFLTIIFITSHLPSQSQIIVRKIFGQVISSGKLH